MSTLKSIRGLMGTKTFGAKRRARHKMAQKMRRNGGMPF